MAQADAPFRSSVEDVVKLRTRNANGDMVPIGSMVDVRKTFGPDPVIRFNGYPSADLIGESDPRLVSSSQALQQVQSIADKVLPPGMQLEWTDLSYQQVTQSNTRWWCSRWRYCWSSWCWRHCTKAGRCRWPSS